MMFIVSGGILMYRNWAIHLWMSLETLARFILETDNPPGRTWARIF